MFLWSIARYDLNLSDQEFFRLTPRQFDALLKRHERKLEHDEFMVAQLTTVVANFSMRPPEQAAKVSDFMLTNVPRKPRRNPPKRKVVAALKSFFGIVRTRQDG